MIYRIYHEFCQIQESLENGGWDCVGLEGRVKSSHKTVLIGVSKLSPAGDKSCVEELPREGRMCLGQ